MMPAVLAHVQRFIQLLLEHHFLTAGTLGPEIIWNLFATTHAQRFQCWANIIVEPVHRICSL